MPPTTVVAVRSTTPAGSSPSPTAMSATVVTVRGPPAEARPQTATAVRRDASTIESTISITAPSTATIAPSTLRSIFTNALGSSTIRLARSGRRGIPSGVRSWPGTSVQSRISIVRR